MRRVNARTLWLVMASLSLLVLASCGCGSGDREWDVHVTNQLPQEIIVETDYFGKEGEGHFYVVPPNFDGMLPDSHCVPGGDLTFPIFDKNRKLFGSLKLTTEQLEDCRSNGVVYLTIDQHCIGDMPRKFPGL